MLRHFISIAWRNISKKKAISLINILGLTIGIASSILIFLWVYDESNFDQFHKNFENIYRVYTTEETSTGTYSQLAVQPPLADDLKAKYPVIASSSRFFILSKTLIKNGQKEFWENKIAFADNAFFEIFTFPFVEGDPRTALLDANSVVLTKETADKYFPNSNPVGQVISIQNTDLTVKGVIENIPENSSLQFDFIVSFEALKALWDWPEMDRAWNSSTFYTYLLLYENVNVRQFEKELIPFYEVNLDWKDIELHIQPLKDVYLNPVEIGEYNLSSSKRTVYLFSVVAILILLIAGINFINLYTAGSTNRAMEIGIKKCLGSKKLFLRVQFLVETTAIVFIAFVLALLTVRLVLPSYNIFINKEVSLNLGNYGILIGLILSFISISTLAGIYPAFYLASLKTETILKGGFFRPERKFSFRKALIVFQFSVTILLMIITLVAFKQMTYIKNKDLGFSKDHILDLTINDDKQYQQFKNELLKSPVIKNVSATNYFSTDGVSNTDCFSFEGQQEDPNFNLTIQYIDFDYFKVLGVEIIEGRDFMPEMKTDAKSSFVLNQKAVDMMGIDQPVGKSFELCGTKGTIIGITNNSNFLSLKKESDPRLYLIKRNGESFENVLVKFYSEPSTYQSNVPAAVGMVEKVWKDIYDDTPFEYRFVDQIYDQIYKTDQRNNQIFVYFTLLAILVSCLGLLGLTLLSAQQRTKEISIRKVHGASITDIISMLNVKFVKLVFIAFLISIPFAYYASRRLLQTFAYRTDVSWWIFLLAGITVILIAVITVSGQSWSISKTNPAETLKYE